jgi:hypothetical protein
MQTTRFIVGAIAFHVAVIRMMGEKEIPSEVDQDIRYGRTQDSTGSHDSSGRRSKEEIESNKGLRSREHIVAAGLNSHRRHET